MVEFKVNVNGVLIKRQWNWGTIVKVKDELKRMGFRWDSANTTWVGKTSRINDLEKLRELLRLSAGEYELLIKPLLKASVRVPRVPEELKQCAMGNRVNVPCVAKLIMEDEYVEADSFEDYVTKLVGKAMDRLGVKDDNTVEEAVKILLNDHSLRETYGRRVEWRLAIVDNGKATLNFLAKGLLKSLREIRVPYNTVDKQGNLNRYEIPVIGRDDVYRDGDKWVIRFPVFEKQTIESLLRKLGYVIKEVEWKPRLIIVPKDNVNLLDFQRNALEAWVKNGYKGTVVIPTGGGKTFIALKAIATVKVPTIILVVTEELMNQWHDRIRRMLGVEAGRLGGGFNEIKDVTVAIYNSAVKYISDIRDRFDLAVFDECHHVPAETFKNVAFKLTAPYRLALSATPTRKDGNEELIYLTSGGVVHKATYLDMVHAGLVVPIRHFRIYVKLSEDEAKKYKSIGEDNAIMLRNTAAQAKAKIPVAVQLTKLEYSLGSKVIVFTQYIEQAEEIYEELKKEIGVKVALITSKTSNRDEIFERFRLGNVKVLVTTTVLDEGIDVPDADVAIVVSGTGSPRQMIQRVGRVVRQTEGKVEARVYEIVARGTIEEALSNERHPDDEVYEKECRKYDEKDLNLLLNRVKAIVGKLKEQGSMLRYVK
ncbi:DEAD/DEAH box helicase [Caldivirga sp.]|uniref:DEAD/DEAH box helicase n=1 Tax=Caldivirga sp. TaxID=2080243 RepID=UPI003D12BDA7